MKFLIASVLANALVLGLAAAPAQAGLGAEADYARANGRWGTELGAGYAYGIAGFKLTAGGGVYLRDGDSAIYGRVEGSFALPMLPRIGVGVRISGEDPRPYALIAMPVFPLVTLKANAGPKYVALGLTVGY